MTNIIQHTVVRSVDITLQLTLTNLPDVHEGLLVSRLQQWADSAVAALVLTDDHQAAIDVYYTLNIKHLADHIVRSFHPTPF